MGVPSDADTRHVFSLVSRVWSARWRFSCGLWHTLGEPLLHVHDRQHRRELGIGIETAAVDALGHQKLRELRVVAGRLATNADLPARCAAAITWAIVRLMASLRSSNRCATSFRITIDARHELRQVWPPMEPRRRSPRTHAPIVIRVSQLTYRGTVNLWPQIAGPRRIAVRVREIFLTPGKNPPQGGRHISSPSHARAEDGTRWAPCLLTQSFEKGTSRWARAPVTLSFQVRQRRSSTR